MADGIQQPAEPVGEVLLGRLALALLCGEWRCKGTSCPEELVNPAGSRAECSQCLDWIYSVKPVIESN